MVMLSPLKCLNLRLQVSVGAPVLERSHSHLNAQKKQRARACGGSGQHLQRILLLCRSTKKRKHQKKNLFHPFQPSIFNAPMSLSEPAPTVSRTGESGSSVGKAEAGKKKSAVWNGGTAKLKEDRRIARRCVDFVPPRKCPPRPCFHIQQQSNHQQLRTHPLLFNHHDGNDGECGALLHQGPQNAERLRSPPSSTRVFLSNRGIGIPTPRI